MIGDTPPTSRAARRSAARTIAVATGSYDTAQLARHEPWALLDRLPEPHEFRRLLSLDV